MSRREVVVVDYDIGNVFSVCNALIKVGASPILTGDHAKIAKAERLVLPGVGAFGKAMKELQRRNLIDTIRAFCSTGRPFLGICVGMQMLMERSTELGDYPGIGFLEGSVERILAKAGGNSLKVPHIGWSALLPPTGATEDRWKNTLCAPLKPNQSAFYFVHSYEARPTNPSDILAEVDYGGHHVVAAVQRNNITGVQFHPERSGPAGQRLLKEFLAM